LGKKEAGADTLLVIFRHDRWDESSAAAILISNAVTDALRADERTTAPVPSV
jgi:hypothetical protein